MGIKDFHTNTKHYISRVHVEQYRGKRIGCDASAWLHRGASPYAWALWHGEAPWNERNEDPPWVSYPMKMIEMLRRHGVEPVLVFDGCRNPAKAPTSHLRAERRKKAEHRARAALSSHNEEEARKAIMQTVEVTPQMAYDLIQRLHAYKVQFIVAPYEADAQLAYLSMLPPEQGGIAAVLTEDSDLIAYGCNALLFKCDVKGAGSADEMLLDRMLSVSLETILKEKQEAETALEAVALAATNNVAGQEIIDLTVEPKNTKPTGGKHVSFFNWDNEMVLSMCILAGCDFWQNICGLGFKTAYSLVETGRTLDGTFAHMRQHRRWKEKLTPEYAQGAKRARESFLYPLVFDPMSGTTTRLRELPDHLRDLPDNELPVHIGPEMESTLVHGIAHGYINPHTMEPFDIRIPPQVFEKTRWTIQLHPPKLFLDSSNTGNTGNWFTAGRASNNTTLGNTVNVVAQFVNSPAASGRCGAGAVMARNNNQLPPPPRNLPPQQQQQRQVTGSQSSPPPLDVQDLMQMYTTNKNNHHPAQQPAAPAAATKTGRSRFAPASMTNKSSNYPFATVARAPVQPPARPQQQQQQKQRPPQPMAMAPFLPRQQQQQPQQPAWFRGPNVQQSQQTASLGSLFNNGSETTTATYSQPWQRQPQQQQLQPQQPQVKEGTKSKPMVSVPLRLPSRTPLHAVVEGQPSASLNGLFSTSTTTGGTANRIQAVQILNNSVFFSGTENSIENNDVAGGGVVGVGGVGGWSNSQEVTSPLKGQGGYVHTSNNRNHNKAEKPMAMAPRMPTSTIPRNNHRSKQQQQQKSTAVWNVRKPTMATFPSFGGNRSTSTENSSGGSGGKRRSGDGGSDGGKKKTKKMAEMQAAAAHCARISAFFAPKKS